ncbi:MAG: hypothetical protein Harvfovirus45_4 [Harvfovirus sp.]|uniref:Sel1 repeat family protein n=1 Tax=Harvfovirus sp. TaxID=2487768 RepID=A0A3G5A2Z8_9VIRU|nr:MAG: hypothetical protein Harvfovirus45_4 [Harvfovirus sp.]
MFKTLKDIKECLSKRIGTRDISNSEDRKDSIKSHILHLDPPERKELFDWLTAESADPCIKNIISVCYTYGICVERNLETALLFAKDAAILGNHYGCFYVALILELQGKNKTLLELAEITIFLKRAAEFGNDLAMLRLGRMCLAEGNLDKALVMFENSARCKNDDAMHKLGEIYWEEKNDFKQAEIWLLQAITAGNRSSVEYLADICFIREDYLKALPLLEKSTFWGNSRSQWLQGIIHHRLKNTDKAITIFKRGVFLQDQQSMNSLAELYVELKYPVPTDVIIDLLTKAATPISYMNLSKFYHTRSDKLNSQKYYLLANCAKYDNAEKENKLLKEKLAALTAELIYRPGSLEATAAEKNFNHLNSLLQHESVPPL